MELPEPARSKPKRRWLPPPFDGFTGYFHRPLSLGKYGVQPDTKPQGQATTILARDLLIHSFSSDKKLSRYLKAHSEPGILRQVHPLNSPTIRWSPHKTMSENEAFELADRYTHILIQSQQTSPNQSIIPLAKGEFQNATTTAAPTLVIAASRSRMAEWNGTVWIT